SRPRAPAQQVVSSTVPAAAARPDSEVSAVPPEKSSVTSTEKNPAAENDPVDTEANPEHAETAQVPVDPAAREDSESESAAVAFVSDSQTFRRAFRDMRDGFHQRELGLARGWQDIKRRARRRVIGPLWGTRAAGVQAATLGVLCAALLAQPLRECRPSVTVGLCAWNVSPGRMLEGSEVFIRSEGLMKQ